MKTFVTLCLLFITGFAFSQRVLINGEIKVPVGEDPQGVLVTNTTAMRATISNASGLFQMRVAEGDTLNFSSLQFSDFSVLIDSGVIETRQLTVFISESVTELPEVVVTPYDLTGNVRVDVKLIPTEDLDLPTMTAADIDPYEWEFPPDSLVSPPNAAMRTGMIENGLNFANIFRDIFRTRRNAEIIDDKILLLYDDAFFQQHLNIEKTNIREFIAYAEDNGLTTAMLDPKNELDLIDFLIAQSESYKERKGSK